MKWPTYKVQYWDQHPSINDCFGNSKHYQVKARNEVEAIRKTKHKVSSYCFRFGKVEKISKTLDPLNEWV